GTESGIDERSAGGASASGSGSGSGSGSAGSEDEVLFDEEAEGGASPEKEMEKVAEVGADGGVGTRGAVARLGA
ncbi:hypothetical protein EVG20_g9580, partial [Dentipellis fragilis]